MEKITISSTYSKDFVKRLPEMLNHLLIERIKKTNIIKTQIYEILRSEYKIKLSDVTKSIKQNFIISELRDGWQLSIDSNAKIAGYKLLSIIQFIDYGNLNCKGIYLITSTLRYLKNNIATIYSLYMLKGGKFPWE